MVVAYFAHSNVILYSLSPLRNELFLHAHSQYEHVVQGKTLNITM